MIKAITWPLQSIANRSGKRMQALAPKLKELQAKHKEQPEKLQTETFVFNLGEALTTPPELPAYKTVLTDDHTVEVEVSKGQSLNDIFSQLSSQGVRVISMRNKVNRLEELFMRLVDDSVRAAEKAS